MKKQESGGGPIMDIGVHALDLTYYLMSNYSPNTVYASRYSHLAPKGKEDTSLFDVEDLASALIKMENGTTVMFEASWVTHIEGPRFYVELMGEKARSRILSNFTHQRRVGQLIGLATKKAVFSEG